MAADPESVVTGVVAHVPVTKGGKNVDAFLNALRDGKGELPLSLKGARNVFLGRPMPPADACLHPKFFEGLRVLEPTGLHFEFCCQSCALPYVAEVCAKFPKINFVLDHLGHNESGEDLETWSKSISAVAANPNVYCKLGAIEEWQVKDPLPYLQHALKVFGIDRCLYESNWFVSAALGDPFEKTFQANMAALQSLGWDTEEHFDKVFRTNAIKVYRL
eukprot:TRINITY_DN13985_c1_g2_i1.p1 TRINITY_DN13985_c1_g2~~TRINITY_DN13985_c1_g2_i1.p1  ORF type:complete len:231 (+),score=33.39 TRINITY_DN13985_c1_g2_i1:41-694(+)